MNAKLTIPHESIFRIFISDIKLILVHFTSEKIRIFEI